MRFVAVVVSIPTLSRVMDCIYQVIVVHCENIGVYTMNANSLYTMRKKTLRTAEDVSESFAA